MTMDSADIGEPLPKAGRLRRSDLHHSDFTDEPKEEPKKRELPTGFLTTALLLALVAGWWVMYQIWK